jgi:two-component system, NtrC family, response regulator AtoC
LKETHNETIRLLVVSKEQTVLRLLWSIEESNHWHVDTAPTGWDAMERVQSGVVPHLLLLDIPRGDANSLHFLRWLRRLKEDLPVVLLCYPDDAAQGKEAVRLGGGELLARPFDAKQLEFVIRRHLAPPAGNGEAELVSKNIEPLGQDAFFVSASLIMQKLRAQAALMAKTDVPVLILGERGAGKFTVAGLIHKLSVRSGFKLLRVNCAEMPESVIEAELFGNDGSIGGRRGPGKFAGAENGTIFLDEIAGMSPALQSKLLRVLQNDEFRSSAGTEAVSSDPRILAASSTDLERALAEKRLREDLYYRLSAFTVHVPPLRQRKDEIGILLRYFMHKLAKFYNLPSRPFSSAVLDACQDYAWPGNLKELEAFVKRYLVAGDEELNFEVLGLASADLGRATLSPTAEWKETSEEERIVRPQESRPESLKSLIQGIKSEAEQNAIGAALKRTGWNRKAAARLLRVSYRTLLYKIEQYNMRAPEPFLSPLPAGEFSVFDEVKNNGKAS